MRPSMENWLPRHRITVDEYYRMAEVGLLAADARVELIEGEIIDMAPIGSRHGGTVQQLHDLLVQAAGARASVRVQLPVRLSRSSEPQPDIALVKPRADYYKSRHPTAADTLLIVEVSDTTFRYDRQIKLPLYARHGIPEAWIADLEGKQMHFFRSPSGESYADAVSISQPGMRELAQLPGVSVELAGVLTR